MLVPGYEMSSMDADWLGDEPDISSGNYVIHSWNSSCSTCIEKIPVLKDLREKYPLEVLGIHSPEFGFEDRNHVEREAEKRGIEYPLAAGVGGELRSNRYSQDVFVSGGKVRAVARNLDELEIAVLEELGEDLQDTGEPRDFDVEDLGLRGCSGINNSVNFIGEQELSAPPNRLKNRVYLDGVWRQTENYLEAVEGRLYFPTDAEAVDVVASPAGSIKDIGVSLNRASGRLENDCIRLKNPGLNRLTDEKGEKEIIMEPDRGTRIYRLNFTTG